MKLSALSAIAVSTAAWFCVAAPAHAATPLLRFTHNKSATNITWKQSKAPNDTGGSIFGNNGKAGLLYGTVDLLQPTLPSGLPFQLITFSGTAPNGNPDFRVGNTLFQRNIGGSFQIIYNGKTKVINGHLFTNHVTNLLSGTYSNAFLIGKDGGHRADFRSGGLVSFTSDVLNLTGQTGDYFDLTILGIKKYSADLDNKDSVNTFIGRANGVFGTGGVPEPSAWAIMITGMGLVGGALRRRSKATVAV